MLQLLPPVFFRAVVVVATGVGVVFRLISYFHNFFLENSQVACLLSNSRDVNV